MLITKNLQFITVSPTTAANPDSNTASLAGAEGRF
jgi:hypothetical protein